jgi:hypothetical protein
LSDQSVLMSRRGIPSWVTGLMVRYGMGRTS